MISLLHRFQKLRVLPIRYIIPSVITLLALCLGLTAIRHSLVNQFEKAVTFVLLACVLDGVDGRVARLLKGTTRFGAELDSLADFVNFGVVPGLLIYIWMLQGISHFGWVVVLIYIMAMGLRLARFNIMFDKPMESWMRGYFHGVPAPFGAILLLLPFYFNFIETERMQHFFNQYEEPLTVALAFYTVVIAMLLISTLPTFSFKHITLRLQKHLVLPILVLITVFMFLIMVHTWPIMIALSLGYMALLPISCAMYMRRLRAETA